MKKKITKKKPAPKRRKKTIVEKVMTERNLIVGPVLPPSVSPILFETEQGSIRIEGKVTPEKLKLATDFAKIFAESTKEIFAESTKEILDLSVLHPSEEAKQFISKANLDQSKIDEIKEAPAWSVFFLGGEYLMKTQDHRLETVKNYCYRLEKAVLTQIDLKKQEVARFQNLLDFKTGECIELKGNLAKTKQDYRETVNKLVSTQDRLRTLLEQNMIYRICTFYTNLLPEDSVKKLFLKLEHGCVTVKNSVLKLLSK